MHICDIQQRKLKRMWIAIKVLTHKVPKQNPLEVITRKVQNRKILGMRIDNTTIAIKARNRKPVNMRGINHITLTTGLHQGG